MASSDPVSGQVSDVPRVLVTGAAGGAMGATGRTLAQLLLDRGLFVRAFVRTDDERAAKLRAAGAEVVVGDLLRFEDVQRAAQGMNYMYFAFAVQAGLLEATTNAAIAAHEAGVKGIINNSQWCADFHSVSPTSRLQAQSEAIFDAFPTPAVHVRGATYHNNIYGQFSKMARESGVLLAPDIAAAEKLPLISGTDVAAAAAAVLADFKKYAGQALLLVGQLHSMDAIAADFSELLGRKVTFQTATTEAWLQNQGIGRPKPGTAVNTVGLEHLTALWKIMQMSNHDAEFVKEGPAAIVRLESLIRRKPIPFKQELAGKV